MTYGPKYCLAGLLAILALISLSQSVVSEKAILMSYNRALKDLMSCQGTKTLLVKVNISPTHIISVCEYLKHVALSVSVNQDKALKHVALSVSVNQDKAANHLSDIDISAADQSNIHLHQLKRYKNLESEVSAPPPLPPPINNKMAFRPTVPGHSPGAGHRK